jgi:hypothetical protein
MEEFAVIAFWIGGIIAWITSVVSCIQNENWVLLVFDFLFFPVGVIHGIMIWFT